MDKPYDRQIESLAEKIVKTYEGDSGINFIDVTNLPVRDKILTILDLLMEVLFPGYTGKKIVTHDDVQAFVRQLLEEDDFRAVKSFQSLKAVVPIRFWGDELTDLEIHIEGYAFEKALETLSVVEQTLYDKFK